MNELKKAERPEVVYGSTWGIPTGCGTLYVIVNRIEGRIFEVFITGGKSGGCMTSQAELVGKLVSAQARYGIPIDEAFALKFKGMSCHNKLEKGKAQSCADAMAIAIKKDIALYKESQPEQLNIDSDQEDKDG